jgi:hypothetical protein
MYSPTPAETIIHGGRDSQSDGVDCLAGRRIGLGFVDGAGDDDGGGGLEQFALVRDVPLDGAVIKDRIAHAHRALRDVGLSVFAAPAQALGPAETLLRSLYLVQLVEQALA